jgi:hypothetical protein
MLFANHLAVSFVIVHSECYSTLRATEVRRLKTALWSMRGWC